MRCSLELQVPQAETSHLPRCPPLSCSDTTPKKPEGPREALVSGYFPMTFSWSFPHLRLCHIPSPHMAFAFFFYLFSFSSVLAEQQAFLHLLPLAPSLCQHPGRPLGDKHRIAIGFNTAAFKDKVPFSSCLPSTASADEPVKLCKLLEHTKDPNLPFQPFPTSTTAAKETLCRERDAVPPREP